MWGRDESFFGSLYHDGIEETILIPFASVQKITMENTGITRAMTRKQYEAIVRCLHLVDNDEVVTDKTQPGYSPIAKMEWLV